MDSASTAVAQDAHMHDNLDFVTTDSGNADILIGEHGRDFKYCEQLGDGFAGPELDGK